MWADDTKIWSRIGGLNDCVREGLKQADINQLHFVGQTATQF